MLTFRCPRPAARLAAGSLAAGLALLAAGAAPAAAAGVGATGPSAAGVGADSTAGGALVQIAGNVLPSLTTLASTDAPADAPLTVGVALAHPDPAAERAYTAALYTPGAAQFHHFLSSAAYDNRFGVPHALTADVVARLRVAGLTVGQVASAGDYVSARGTVGQVEQAFGVDERVYTSGGHTFTANAAGPMVPAGDEVLSVIGLNTLQQFQRDQNICQAGVCTGNTTPQDLWSVYQQPNRYRGAGGRVAIIGEGQTASVVKDLAAQEKAYGLPAIPVTVQCTQATQDVGNGVQDCGTDNAGSVEWDIDMQASGGMAPDAAGETLYFANSILDGDLNNSFIAWAQDDASPPVANASLGECESSPANGVFTGPLGPTDGNTSGGTTAVVAFGNGEQAAVDPVLAKAVMAGKTLFASTGDTGSSCPAAYLPVIGAGNGVANQVVPEQNYPAVSVSAVGVGGTVLYTNNNGEGAGSSYQPGKPPATRSVEHAWTFGGGGASLYTTEPSWQAKVANINQPCVIGSDGQPTSTGTTCRGLPDVAAQSGDVTTNGYSIVTGEGTGGAPSFGTGGGTSLSSPLWAGMWTRVASASGTPLGFAAPLLYQAGTGTASYGRDFTDVLTGGNGLHAATPGWDYTTGFGTAQVDGLICDLDGLGSGRFAAGVSGACAAQLASGPTPVVPEAPGAALLVVAGVGAVGLVVRRRARRA